MEAMAEAYPDLTERADYVAKVVRVEEERFIQTLDNGLRILNDEVDKLRKLKQTVIPGEIVFRLYDTFGFPVDLTADIVEGAGFTLDEAGFETCMEQQRQKAREHWKGSGEEAVSAIYRRLLEEGVQSEFTGYHNLSDYGTIAALIKDGQPVAQAIEGDRVELITTTTPFYGESGGQAGDRGEISTGSGRVRVEETRKPLTGLTVHVGTVTSGTVQQGEAADLSVDAGLRQATALNHTATHILQAVLVEVLGDHVKQAGSLVTPERLRFDFTHFSPVSAEELARIEAEVNRRIRDNQQVETDEMAAEAAIAAGATALFGEKYGDRVRVVRVGDFSMELCGGTHIRAAGDIGLFKIVQETGIAAGVRRIEATTGARALEFVRQEEQTLERLAGLVKSDRTQLENRLQKLLERQKELEREVEALQARLNSGRSSELLEQAREVAGTRLLTARVDGLDGKALRELADKLRDRLGSGIIVLGGEAEGKVSLLVAVTSDLTGRFQAGQLIRPLAELVGGKGGGRPELAQAGGTRPEGLDQSLAAVETLIAGTPLH
jgi:alanyl-tRNA synthetase